MAMNRSIELAASVTSTWTTPEARPVMFRLLPLMATQKHAYSIIFSLFSPRTNNFNVLGKY